MDFPRTPQVVDIGCGEGELLACLAQPAPWLRPLPHSLNPTKSRSADYDSDNGPPYNVPDKLIDPHESEIANLHCTKIQGLDISSSDLQYAVAGTAPPQSAYKYIRWEPLEAKIWHGALESVNPEFIDVECIVSTEVYVLFWRNGTPPSFSDLLSALNISPLPSSRSTHLCS
jgi:small RNA 2'-O-methyltransferase